MARVLIVDDEPTDMAIVRGIVEIMGHEVHVASDGQEGLETYLSRDIELVITDLEMPRVGGLAFIEALIGFYPDAKIVACSAGGADLLQAAKRAGATALISKPVGPEELSRAFTTAGFG